MGEAAGVLLEIDELKRRFGRPATLPPTRAAISRHHRRFSLGAEARRILKRWVNENLEDPYPSMAEKQELATRAHLSLKQVNDWFTNYRKRHWEEELQDARV